MQSDKQQLNFLRDRYNYLLERKWELEILIYTQFTLENDVQAELPIYSSLHREMIEIDEKRTQIIISGDKFVDPYYELPPNPRLTTPEYFTGTKDIYLVRLKTTGACTFELHKMPYITETNLRMAAKDYLKKKKLKRVETENEICYYSKRAFDFVMKDKEYKPEFATE